MKKKVLKLAVLALMVGSMSSCNKEVNGNETTSTGTSQTELASDKLLGGIANQEEVLFCNSYITVKESENTVTGIITLLSSEGGFDVNGNEFLKLNLERDGNNLIINEGEENKIRPSITTGETEDTFTVERIGDTPTNQNETSIFSVDVYNVGDNATAEIVTIEVFNAYHAGLDSSITTSGSSIVPPNYNIDSDVILKIKISEQDGIDIITKTGYYFYTRTL